MANSFSMSSGTIAVGIAASVAFLFIAVVVIDYLNQRRRDFMRRRSFNKRRYDRA